MHRAAFRRAVSLKSCPEKMFGVDPPVACAIKAMPMDRQMNAPSRLNEHVNQMDRKAQKTGREGLPPRKNCNAESTMPSTLPRSWYSRRK